MLPKALASADIPTAADAIARAFIEDPLWRYLFPDAGLRATLLLRCFRFVVSAGVASGGAYGTGDPLGGVALWSIPGQPRIRLTGALLAALPPLLLSRFTLAVPRVASIFGLFDEKQKQYAPGPHYYLQTIGVAPEARGRGYATQLIQPFLDEADSRGMGAYTETVTPENVGLYERFGFQVMEAVPTRQGLTLWCFYRPARHGADA
jgi:ribosomal protein S18 acetylase RimI-like enzyme